MLGLFLFGFIYLTVLGEEVGGLVIFSYLFLLEGIIIRLIGGGRFACNEKKNECKYAVKKKRVCKYSHI